METTEPASLTRIIRESVSAWSHGGARLLSGAVAFYALLSLVPVFVIAIRVAGLATSEEAARGALLRDLARWIGRDGADTVGALLTSAAAAASSGHWVLEAAVLVYASTRLFAVLQKALHMLWNVPLVSPEKFAHKVVSQLRRRSMAFVFVLLVGSILVALTVWHGVATVLHERLGGHHGAWRSASAGFSFLLSVLLFTAIFKVLPEARVSLRDAALGGVVTAVLFSLGSLLIGGYVGHKGGDSFFGAASSVVMLLLWVNYSAQVFFLGAAFTGVHARLRGAGIHPVGAGA